MGDTLLADHFTVFGGSGFVGGEISRLLESQGHTVTRVTRASWPEPRSHLGHVIFTIGMTADFRKRLVETLELQVLRLHDALTGYTFDSFVYLSSARVYADAISTAEHTPLLVRPYEADHVYNISKLAGESLCFAQDNPRIRVVRMSNVYGAQDTSNLFLTAVMREAVETGSVTIGQSPQSSKDYIWVGDAATAIVRIAQSGSSRLYNVAAGINVTHQNIADILAEAGYRATFKDGGALVKIPEIDMRRYSSEFGTASSDPRTAIFRVLKELQKNRTAQ
jgi:nucleoside-diphosphate-sugar epimerase